MTAVRSGLTLGLNEMRQPGGIGLFRDPRHMQTMLKANILLPGAHTAWHSFSSSGVGEGGCLWASGFI